jgi:hypothetical protein
LRSGLYSHHQQTLTVSRGRPKLDIHLLDEFDVRSCSLLFTLLDYNIKIYSSLPLETKNTSLLAGLN